MGKTITPIVVALIIAVSLVKVANTLSDTALDIKSKGYVTAKGFAKQQIRSDLGIFEATITVEDADLKKCYEKLASDRAKVFSLLTGNLAISEKEIELKPARVREIYKINQQGFTMHELDRYALEQNLRVQSGDVDKIALISLGIVEILKEGVLISIAEPQFIYTKLDDLKIEMIGKATDNARQRAEVVADKGNFELGSIADVRTGIFQITPVNSTMVSDYGINDTTSIDKEIQSVVEIRYFVE